jgi:NAD(P)H-nitrite reductase large subunit
MFVQLPVLPRGVPSFTCADMPHVVIVGNGIAGATAARYLRKGSDYRITMISAEHPFFYSRPALMYAFMGHMEVDHLKPYEDGFWKKNRIDLLLDYVTHIDTSLQVCTLASAGPLQYDYLILATGSVANRFGWPGQDLDGVQTFTSMQDLGRLDQNVRGARSAVIVGGGLIGVEVAEMLHSRGLDVHFLVRESSYWNTVLAAEESAMISRHIVRHGIHLHLSTQLMSFEGGPDNRVRAAITSGGNRLECQVAVLTAGVRPQIHLAQTSGIPTQRGILVDDSLCTSITNVYAIGDCAEFPSGKVEQLWYTARHHGQHVASVILGKARPLPGYTFYNSAKFFDIEYQTYGVVSSSEDGTTSVLWQDEQRERLLRIIHNAGVVTGIQALGMRLRAEQCIQWIDSKATVQEVIQGIQNADFDPEFSRSFSDVRFSGSIV